jgi:hypothetical protein
MGFDGSEARNKRVDLRRLQAGGVFLGFDGLLGTQGQVLYSNYQA